MYDPTPIDFNKKPAVKEPKVEEQHVECTSSDNGNHQLGEYIEGAVRCHFCGEAMEAEEQLKENQDWNNIFDRFNLQVADKALFYVTASDLARWLEANYNSPSPK